MKTLTIFIYLFITFCGRVIENSSMASTNLNKKYNKSLALSLEFVYFSHCKKRREIVIDPKHMLDLFIYF